MQTEIEAKFLDADLDEVRKNLESLGGVCVAPLRLMKRKHYDYPDSSLQSKNAFVRLRDEGGKITLAYKQLNDRTVQGTKEANVVVDDFDQANELLIAMGFQQKSYHETKRESWKLGGIEIEFDEWPWLDPYVEIEAKTEQELWGLAEKLGLSKANAVHGTVDIVYAQKYNVIEAEVNALSDILFSQASPWEKR